MFKQLKLKCFTKKYTKIELNKKIKELRQSKSCLDCPRCYFNDKGYMICNKNNRVIAYYTICELRYDMIEPKIPFWCPDRKRIFR